VHAQVDDEIVVDRMEVGVPSRKGTILEVRGEVGEEHFLVRWSDGHESIFFPGSTAHTIHPSGHRGS
jgi:hypothetical protein